MAILDFLYADHERVASFLAQLTGGDGVLKEVSASANKSKDTRVGVAAGINLLGIGVKGSGSDSVHVQRDTRLVYDPLWNNSIRLVEAIQERYQNDAIGVPRIGQLRLISGSLRVFDIGYLPELLKIPAMVSFIMKGADDEDGESAISASGGDKLQEAEAIQAYFSALPFGIQFLLDDGNDHFWFSLKRQFLSLYDLDIPLKFPQKISGNWTAIGIVDAAPDDDSMEDIDELPEETRRHIPLFMKRLSMLAENTNDRFGRQDASFGLSPLMIYRELEF